MLGGVSYFSLDSGRVDEDGLPEEYTFGDFAVLYRLNAQARLLEEAFDRSGIPFETVGGTDLADQKPVREVLALLRLTLAPDSTIHWERILSEGKGALSEGTVAKLVSQVKSESTTLGTAPSWRTIVTSASGIGALRQSQRDRLAQTIELMDALTGTVSAPLSEQIEAAAAGWQRLRGDELSDAEKERIDRLVRRAAPYRNRLREFLTTTALRVTQTNTTSGRTDVTLMRPPSSKGWSSRRFVVGCEPGLLPYSLHIGSRHV